MSLIYHKYLNTHAFYYCELFQWYLNVKSWTGETENV